MRGHNRLVSIQYNDGAVKRLPWKKAVVQVELGRADYISRTRYKAAKAGVAVRPGQTDAEIKAAIKAQTPDAPKKSNKSEKKRQRRRRKWKDE